MKSLSSYLLVFFAIVYWIFRVMVCLMNSMGKVFICEPLNPTIEIAILFLTVPSIIFIIRRNVIAATLYFGMYTAYFGTVLYNDIMNVSGNIGTFLFANIPTIMATTLGILIPFFVYADILIQKSRFKPADRENDWYYANEKYDRKYDSRADRNNYKIK